MRAVDKRNGRRVLKRDDLPLVIGNFALNGDHDANTVTLSLPGKTFTFQLTNEPLPPLAEPPAPPKPGFLGGLGGAIRALAGSARLGRSTAGCCRAASAETQMARPTMTNDRAAMPNRFRHVLLAVARRARAGCRHAALGLGRSAGSAHGEVITRGLDWVASTQSRLGHWSANDGRYPTSMTALAGVALLAEGSTTTQGRYAKQIRLAVDYLISRSRPNGLIGDPVSDDRYTYGHGYSMLFLSQVLGEEEDVRRGARS